MNARMVRQVQISAINRQQLVPMITLEIDLLIKVLPNNIIELQERIRRQFPSRPAEAALGDLPDTELLVLSLLKEAVQLSL